MLQYIYIHSVLKKNSKSKKMSQKENKQNKKADSKKQKQEEPQQMLPMLQKNIFQAFIQLKFKRQQINEFYGRYLEEFTFEKIEKITTQFSNLQLRTQQAVLTKIQNCIQYCSQLSNHQEMQDQKQSLMTLKMSYKFFKDYLEPLKKQLPVNVNQNNDKEHGVQRSVNAQSLVQKTDAQNIQQPRTCCSKFQSFISDPAISQLINAIFIFALLFPQYKIIFESWTADKIAILVIGSILVVYNLILAIPPIKKRINQYRQQRAKKQKEKQLRDQKDQKKSTGSARNLQQQGRGGVKGNSNR